MSQNDICMLIGFILGVVAGIIAVGLMVIRAEEGNK